jgi:hypothetical protein
MVEYRNVYLVIQSERPVIKVRGFNQRPEPVNDENLNVDHAWLILEYLSIKPISPSTKQQLPMCSMIDACQASPSEWVIKLNMSACIGEILAVTWE